MAKSVELLKEVLEIEESSVKKYEEVLAAMGHDEAKRVIGEIIEDKKGHMGSLKKIIEQSRKCPAVKK